MTLFNRPLIPVLIATILLCPAVGCSGGGSSRGHVRGVLTDGFGAVINHPAAIIALLGTDEVTHPAADGSFTLGAEAGSYVLRGTFSDPDAAFRLSGSRDVVLSKGQTLDVGLFSISNSTLEAAWEQYRKGHYSLAEGSFISYLNETRSGQAHLGASSALSGLGWTRGRGLDRPADAAGNFDDAIAGWNGNVDAWVGLAGCELSRMRSDGGFHFNDAVEAIGESIDAADEYSSAPTHDLISETDLMAFRSLVNFLNGNTLAARNEALNIRDRVAADGNGASADAIAIVLAFTQ